MNSHVLGRATALADAKASSLQFAFVGFTQSTGRRVFEFECVAPSRVRTQYSVSADLALARKYGIKMQELPLICRAVLEQRSAEADLQVFNLTELDMSVIAHAAQQPVKGKTLMRRYTEERADLEVVVQLPTETQPL